MNYYQEWLQSGEEWMKAYRKQQMRKHTHFIIPAVVLGLTAIFVLSAILNGGTAQDIGFGVFTGILLGAIVCGIYLPILLSRLSPKKMSRNIMNAVNYLAMSEAEQQQLGREMTEAQKDPACVLDYKMVGPKSNGTPAKFIISPNYACLWGSYPLVILVDLSKLAKVTKEEERKTEVTYGAQSQTLHRFNLHTITFYYKGSDKDGDNGMGFFDETIRDEVFGMIEAQRPDSVIH